MVRMATEIRESEGLEILGAGKSYVDAYDHMWGRELRFNHIERLNFKEMVHLNKAEVRVKQFYEILEKLNPSLFMTVRKIVLIQNKWDYNRLVKELEGYEFLEGDELDNCLGKHLFFEGYVIINLRAIKKTVREMKKQADREGYYLSEVDMYNIGFWTTLIHELQHAKQANPLYENDYEDVDKEEDAEQYCRAVFDEQIANRNYWVLPY